MAILIALAMLALVIFVHDACLSGIARLTPYPWISRRKLALMVFCLLALTHLLEISLFAVLYFLLETQVWPRSFGESFGGGFYDYLYFSGMAFTTLGYAEITAAGPIRVIVMFEALIGFMALTWSAAYLYRACGTYWDKEEPQ